LYPSLVGIRVSSVGDKYFAEAERSAKKITKKWGACFNRLPGSRFRFLSCAVRLPAAVSAASAPAITTVAVPASTTTAATATTAAARSPSAATAKAAAATTTAARPPSAATTATLTGRPCFVDDNIAAHEIVAVQSLDGTLGFLVAIDFDKSEPAWLP
jgi:hypothetical protein